MAERLKCAPEALLGQKRKVLNLERPTEGYFSCPVCLDQTPRGLEVSGLLCEAGHFFCRQCISKWLVGSDECPVCRTVISMEAMHSPAKVQRIGTS